MTSQKDDYLFKVVMVGDSGTGKTNLLDRFINDRFKIETRTTIGVEFSSKRIQLKGKTVCVQVWDTAGQGKKKSLNIERYRAISRTYYRGSVGAFVVYDITRKETFENSIKWIKELKEYTENLVIMLIGNKSDLIHSREVNVEEAIEFAKKQNLLFMETSALTSDNVIPAFEKCIGEIMDLCEKVQVETVQNHTTFVPSKGHSIPIKSPIEETINIEEKPPQTSSGCCG